MLKAGDHEGQGGGAIETVVTAKVQKYVANPSQNFRYTHTQMHILTAMCLYRTQIVSFLTALSLTLLSGLRST